MDLESLIAIHAICTSDAIVFCQYLAVWHEIQMHLEADPHVVCFDGVGTWCKLLFANIECFGLSPTSSSSRRLLVGRIARETGACSGGLKMG